MTVVLEKKQNVRKLAHDAMFSGKPTFIFEDQGIKYQFLSRCNREIEEGLEDFFSGKYPQEMWLHKTKEERKKEEEERKKAKKSNSKSTKAQVASGSGQERRVGDYYSTPKNPLDDLMRKIFIDVREVILEPCTGEGAISKYLENMGCNKVISTELNSHSMITCDYGETFTPSRNYGNTGINFLSEDIFKFFYDNGIQYKNNGWVDTILTNPPYCADIEFILQSFIVARKRVIMLMKLNCLSTTIRKDLLWDYNGWHQLDEGKQEKYRKYKKFIEKEDAWNFLLKTGVFPAHYEECFKNNSIRNFKLKDIFIIPYRLLFEGYSQTTPLEFIWIVFKNDYNIKGVNIEWL
jgi:hypothetical protein